MVTKFKANTCHISAIRSIMFVIFGMQLSAGILIDMR